MKAHSIFVNVVIYACPHLSVAAFMPHSNFVAVKKSLIQDPNGANFIKTKLYAAEDRPEQNRRGFLSHSVKSGMASLGIASIVVDAAIVEPTFAATENEDMTSQMFNEDGSLKEGAMKGLSGTDLEAKSKTVNLIFPTSSSSNDSISAIVSVDGIFKSDSVLDEAEAKLKSSYQLPEKWTPAPDYIDTLLSVQKRACDQITIYQLPGKFKDNSILEKATTIGVAKALNFASTGPGIFPKTLGIADIVSGRKVMKKLSLEDGEKNQKYYEFDLAVAPESCGQSAENLNLGFCPYDTIVLISATIVNEKMMVCAVTSNKEMWMRSNADIKRVRNSFFVEEESSVV